MAFYTPFDKTPKASVILLIATKKGERTEAYEEDTTE
jgi:hypothetical protein